VSEHSAFTGFFQRYASISIGPAPEKLADFYDASFLAAGPQGVAAFQNDDAFLGWLRQVHQFNAQTGMTALEAIDVRDTPISNDYALATVRWGARFSKTGEELIEFEISYLLRLTGGGPKVAAYISHEDQEAVMRSRGLL
jgi:hypothetical protein